MLKHQSLTTAELIKCNEKAVTKLHNTDELIDILYSDEHTDCESIILESFLSIQAGAPPQIKTNDCPKVIQPHSSRGFLLLIHRIFSASPKIPQFSPPSTSFCAL